MRYTKMALLTFGAGLLLGLVVVVTEIGWPGRLASGLMALSLVALPLGMIVDWRLATKPPRPPARARVKARTPRARQRSRAPGARKPAPPRR
ncbi:MAG TPA: hypothetical protein VGM07_12220 [Stellaceae bacterium]|jgi:hypothetical protein